MQKEEQEKRTRLEKIRHKKLQALGFEGENIGEVLL